ncbi:MAG TPA: cation-transporting P-type ATPase, partial [Burkholderiaceae bacterium]|nr:cation-transporting P-type ATPase [Burkholderiaceae bacterium]
MRPSSPQRAAPPAQPTPSPIPDSHAQSADAVIAALAGSPGGLDEAEVARRLQRHGPNRLAQARQRSAFRRLIGQFHNVLLYVMLAAAAVTAALGHWIDTGILVGAVLVNAIIGYIQEGRAEAALAAIQDMLSPRATVIRGGQRVEIDATGLVPGDVVALASGDRVPADIRLIGCRELRIEEAVLTGESVAVEKSVDAVAADAPLGERQCMAYSGTVVVYGQGTGVVVATGAATELGRINEMLAGIRSLGTPLLRQIDRFARRLA